ncbi:Fis family transcriptional regulator [Campylobacterota bacterium]|nr:Fis family transcriptional regulator [Campylobacterota bacterium]
MKKIILVDDSRMILASVKDAFEPLEIAGLITYESWLNPKEFLWDLLDGKTNYDLLISDINMPEMNGLELVSIIKTEPAFYHKPILVLSTESSAEMKEKGRQAGVIGWIVKPFNAERLRHVTRLILGINAEQI